MLERYIVYRSAVLDFWITMSSQYCSNVLGVEFDEQKWLKSFALFQQDIWPKYLQAGLYEMYFDDKKMKQTKIKLADEEFEELPVTHVANLSDYSLFEDYLQADMYIETTRALKYHLMPFILHPAGDIKPDKQEHLKSLQSLCKSDFLNRDEFVIYQGLIETLEMGSKWSQQQTDLYLEKSIGDLAD